MKITTTWATKRQHIIELVTEGLKNKEIAVALGTTEDVIKIYMRRIYDELGFSNRVEVALWYIHKITGMRQQTEAAHNGN